MSVRAGQNGDPQVFGVVMRGSRGKLELRMWGRESLSEGGRAGRGGCQYPSLSCSRRSRCRSGSSCLMMLC